MSIDNYSKELRNYISSNTKFINDKSFQTKEELIKNPIILEEFIERELSNNETNCLFFYLSYFIQDQTYLNETIENINKKFLDRNIKAREMPEIHYLIVYKISEEKFLDENINKIKNYFEDYLKQLKEAEELEKMKRKMEEEAKLEAQKEKIKRERFILPKINDYELEELKENSVIISVPLFDEKEIINKNKYNITNCLEKYEKENIEYVVYLYNGETHSYDKRIFNKKKENILKANRYKLEITNLKPNSIYLFLLGIKFGDNYSNSTSNKFYFITSPKIKHGKIFIFGDFSNKNNFVDVNEQENIIILPKDKKTYLSCFKVLNEEKKTIQPLLYGDIIQDISISETRAIFLNSNEKVIQAGQILLVNPNKEEDKDEDNEYFEGSFPEDKIIKSDDETYKISYANVTPYLITFPNEKIKIKKVSTGERHCLALDSKGEVYSWGENDFGQLGLGKDKNEIIGNPKKIKFDIFDLDGHKYFTEQKPIFYDITTGSFSSLALSIFNNRQILYYWGKGAGVLNDSSNEIVLSTYPLPISGVENIKKIYARYNSIGIFCWDNEKKLNVLYIHGTQKFGIDAGIGMYDKPKPIIVNFFRDEGINVLSVNFSVNCISVLGQNKKGENEVYLRGELLKKVFVFKEYKSKFMKLEKEWAKDVVSISPQDKVIFFLLKNGIVKKLWRNLEKNNLEEKEIRIEGYEEILKELNTNDINKIEFQSFLDENFVVFYQSK
jgi:hypothetical protein